MDEEIPSLESWRALTTKERLTFGLRLAAHLDDFESTSELVGGEGVVQLRHRPTSVLFSFIPGSSFEMGLREGDMSLATEQLGGSSTARDWLRDLAASARPVHTVRVLPFLCARHLIDNRTDAVLFDDPPRVGDTRVLHVDGEEGLALTDASKAHGLRLVSEAEWEYVARGGGALPFVDADSVDGAKAVLDDLFFRPRFDPRRASPNRFGIWGLAIGEWVADGAHDDYDGAPDDSRAWDPEDERLTICRSPALRNYTDAAEEAVINCLAGGRWFDDEGENALRLAMDLPES